MKVSAGVGGRGSVTSIDRKEHPDSHFEISRMDIEKAHDGSYVVKHHMRLKKRHEGKEEYSHGYRDAETHTAANPKELMAHVQKHLGGKMAEAEPDAGESAAEEAAE